MATLDPNDKPINKILRLGASNISDTELLCCLLYPHRQTEENLNKCRGYLTEMANDMSFYKMLKKEPWYFETHYTMPERAQMIALKEFVRRYMNNMAYSMLKNQITCSTDAVDILRPLFSGCEYEMFYVLCLNRANRVQAIEKISEGSVAGTVTDPKKIIYKAIMHKSSAIVLAHNHPSGRPNPSEEDNRLTTRIKEACKHMDLTVLDHVIIADNTYFSYADEGLM